MAVVGINTKCFILALFIRDDNERFLLGDGYYEFKNDLKHFQANTIVNDVVEVQGNDGYLLAGQVRRSGTQEFNGYIADGTVSKTTTEDHRRQFFSFFRKNHFYKVVYVMPDGSAIQRKRGFLVDDPTVSEMYQQYPEYHVALNFEDINYYVYDEDSEGHEIYGKSAVIGLIQGLSGGLIWDALGAVSDGFTWVDPVNVSGANITIDNQLEAMVPIEDLELKGDTSQASSPTPDAPQAINVVTGEQSVMFLANKNMQPLFSDGSISSAQTMTAGCLTVAQFYSSYNQTLTASNGILSTTSTGTSIWKMKFVGLEPSTQYTISATFDVTLNGTDKRFFALGNYRHTQPDQVTGRFSKTITTDASGKWETASSTTDTLFYIYTNSSIIVSDIQLEKASSASDYVPYHLEHSYTVNLGSIELAKIGTYQDYIYKSSGNWYVHKATNKIILSQSSDVTNRPGGQVNDESALFYCTPVNDGLSRQMETTSYTLSDHFVPASVYGSSITINGYFISNNHTIAIRARGDSLGVSPTLENFKSWITQNPVTIYYALATPTDTQITDATLISQLDALGAMRLYIGENNLSVSSASLPAILDFDYYSGIDYSGAGYEWEDGGTGGPETITVDSIDNVYPVWTVTGPALNPQLSVLTTNTTTTYAGTVAVGQTLVIDMFNKTATLNGTSVIGNVAGDWANFKPGNNRVIYSTNNADAPASKIEWQEVVG